tara:strand:+ start:857 stop:1255 length:399 start_codon:yes stop_codon:yes gene_type:complete
LAQVTSLLGADQTPKHWTDAGPYPKSDQVLTGFSYDRLTHVSFLFRSGTVQRAPFERTRARAFGVFGPETLMTEVLSSWGEPDSWSTDDAGWNDVRSLRYRVGEACVDFQFDNGALVYLTVSELDSCYGHVH